MKPKEIVTAYIDYRIEHGRCESNNPLNMAQNSDMYGDHIRFTMLFKAPNSTRQIMLPDFDTKTTTSLWVSPEMKCECEIPNSYQPESYNTYSDMCDPSELT